MTGPVMMTLEQPTLAQPASNGLLGQRFEETRREVVRLRRTNDYLRETLATHEHLIRLLEGIRECLERRNDDLMEICACKNFLRPENAHLINDDLKDLYSQYYQVKSTQGLPVNLSTSTPMNSNSPSSEKFSNNKCLKRSPPQMETSTLSPTSSTNHHQTMPSPSPSSLSPSFSSSSSAPSTGARSSSSPASQLSSLSSSAAALLSLSAAIAAVNATSSTDLSKTNSSNNKKVATSIEDEQMSNGTNLKTEPELESIEIDESKEEVSQDKPQGLEQVETSLEVKKEIDEDDIDSDDDNLEIEIDDDRQSDNEDEEEDKFYDEMQTDESQDASRSGSESTTRLPILKSMLSPVEQTEEKIEINLNPNDFFAGNAAEATNNEASDLSSKSDLSKSTREPATSSSVSDNGREVSTSSNSFSVSSSSSPPNGDKSNTSMMSNAAAAAAAALFANSLQQLNPNMAPSPLPSMPPPISNLRIALSSNSSRKPPVPPSMLATLAAANGLNINMDAIRPHKCHWPDCKFATKDRKTLRTHMRIHTKEKPFKCSFPNCSYETGDPSNYRKHKRRHIAHTIFACDYEGCNFTTNKPDFMQSHIAIHKGLKPFLCDFENCNSSFYTRSKLEAHRRKHLASGEFPMSLTHVEDKDKPIMCTYPNCGKRFINAAGLAGHEVTHLATHNKYGAFLAEHEREKPVVCNFPNCGKRFLNTAGLAGHEVTHRNFISQNMGAIFKNLSFNQLKNLGIFSVANMKQQQQSGQNSPIAQQQQLQQHLQAQLLLQAVQKGTVEGDKSRSVSNGKNGEVIVVDI